MRELDVYIWIERERVVEKNMGSYERQLEVKDTSVQLEEYASVCWCLCKRLRIRATLFC